MAEDERNDKNQSNQAYKVLEKYTRDLTEMAKNGSLDPVVGRDDEIRRTIQIIARRTKNNPVLIGDPGVGKTAIAEGLALRIINGDIPETLKDKKLLSLDLASIVAGAKFRGEFEERLNSLLDEINRAAGEIILFIDELHTLIGTGASEGSLDASNMLKPALARGTLHCIGATTLDEYRKHIEKDAALARRFQPILVKEPSISETINILRGLKEKYELHHGVQVMDKAIISAVKLSDRYISERFLPDKAIDLIDEAASSRRMEIDSKPEEIDVLDRKIMALKIEQEAVRNEPENSNDDRLHNLEDELSILQERSETLTKNWNDEKATLGRIQSLQETLERTRQELLEAQRSSEYEDAGRLLYSEIPNLENKLQSLKSKSSKTIVKEEVTSDDIASIVSRWTGIPLTKMISTEQEKLLTMETFIRKKVIGQSYAIREVVNAVQRARAGLQDPSQPIGSFLFLGPTGVGKTELSKVLATFLFDNAESMTRIDMSEFMESHSVARMIGAPPGYVGYEEGGVLTEAVRRRPYQVLLFDEIEKAHSEVLNILLQVLDDGRLTDGQGRTVNFRNTIIIMTSNIGANHFLSSSESGEFDSLRGRVMEEVRKLMRPEFLNRLDDIILFSKLSISDMEEITDLQINQLRARLKNKDIDISLDASVKTWLAKTSYDPRYGARPLKRVIQNHLQNPIAKHILEGSISEGDTIRISANDDHLSISPIT
ncbi:MAG: ATP-dependent Clp protease ATP-binding subunit [Thalassobaculaceae bacterium]